MDLKQFQPTVSPEQAKACQTAFGKAAPAACTDANKDFAAKVYAAHKALSSAAPTAAKVAPAGDKAFWDGVDAAGERNRQQHGETGEALIFKHLRAGR